MLSVSREPLDLFDLDKVLDLKDHAADGLVVNLIDSLADTAKTKGLQGFALIGLAADGALNLRDTQGLLCDRLYLVSFRPKMWSSETPRRSAT